MSTIVCGFLRFADATDDESQALFSWRLLAVGTSQRVFVSLGCCIPQLGVFDLLSLRTRALQPRQLAFLLTASPVHDTSEELIWPMEATEGFHERVHGSIDRISSVVAWALADEVCADVTLVLTESGNVPHEERRILIGELSAELRSRLCVPYDVQPTRWLIGR